MKAWFNEKHNWCLELERDEDEMLRLATLVSEGMVSYRETHLKYPKEDVYTKAYLSVQFMNYLFSVVLVGQNYTQSNPTIDKPIEIALKDAVRSAVENFNHMYTDEEVEFIKSLKDKRDIL